MAAGSCESQKLQTRISDESIAPHCKHVLFTGRFCAADASTPARSESENRIARGGKVKRENGRRGAERSKSRELRKHLLGKQIAAEGDTAAQDYGGEITTLRAFSIRP
jgi:hypothetical protein